MKDSYHHGDLRDELIQTGLQMIRQSGIEHLSLRKLSSICHVSEAAPYSHFKNKDELLMAMQEFITQQLQTCLENAYENTKPEHSADSILNMGKAYVLFFIQYPEYYTFLFSQPWINIDLSLQSSGDSFAPFQYYKEKVHFVYRKQGLSDERIKYGIIAMWAKVHGIAAIASMRCVTRDFEWEDILDHVLVE